MSYNSAFARRLPSSARSLHSSAAKNLRSAKPRLQVLLSATQSKRPTTKASTCYRLTIISKPTAEIATMTQRRRKSIPAIQHPRQDQAHYQHQLQTHSTSRRCSCTDTLGQRCMAAPQCTVPRRRAQNGRRRMTALGSRLPSQLIQLAAHSGSIKLPRTKWYSQQQPQH